VTERISLDDLARWTGEPAERLQHWRDLGLIGGDGDGFTPEDLEQAGLMQFLLRRGMSLESIGDIARELGPEMASYIRLLFPEGVPQPLSTAEAAESMGLDPAAVRRLLAAAWPGRPPEYLYADDIVVLDAFKAVVNAGIPESAIMELIKVYADALSRVAEAETRMTRHYFFGAPGETKGDRRETVSSFREVIERLYPLATPLIEHFHRRALMQASREDVARNMAEEFGLVRKPTVPGESQAAIAFIDISSFTPLTAEMGDLKAAEILVIFSDIVRESTARFDGGVVKQIGDAFMLVFPESAPAVACLLEIERRAADETQFPAVRGGIASGSVLYREGDYVGAIVNLASRLAGEAERHQVIITPEVRKEAAGLPDVEFAPVGKRRLKGLTGEFELFEARAAGSTPVERAIDPVCGMELGVTEVAVSLTLDGVVYSFCSEDCLRKFVVSPESYRP
jgi:class 3 adenylate cyclase/DNA-binding transcriptional MerR regulator